MLSDRALHFNISHSHHLALFAISRDVAVGCDIESHDERFLGENIPAHFFAPAEVAALNAMPQADRLDAQRGLHQGAPPLDALSLLDESRVAA